MSKFDYRDPGTDPAYCDGLSDEPPDFDCLVCGNIEVDNTHFPYCSVSCERQAVEENDEDEPNPRQRGDDDGREYADPRDARDAWLNDW